ncbi:tetratricopeptide repeat protein [Nonomuraea sp. NBC_00507]|uniref:tetratricopeptide repeat protein n=1 Tax=Nonomuraea sp. NBC_00507 TaxID=2976002 RepID=UPI002E177059
MPRWGKVTIAAVLPLMAGVVAWWLCAAQGLDLDTTGIVIGLVVLLPATPLAIWAGQPTPAGSAQSNPAEPGSLRENGSPPASGASASRVIGEMPHARPVPAVIGDVPREPKAFQPRPPLRERVESLMAAEGGTAVCALAGARGVGKTQLAAHYARRCLDQGVQVAWLHAETSEQLSRSLDVLATELGLRSETDDSTALARKVKRWLQDRREPYLVVFDNATDVDALARLLPAHGRARVLITTNDWAFERVAALVEVERFSDEEALAYLAERVGQNAAAGLVAEELDHLPLALSIASAVLVGPPRVSYEEYLERLRATPIDVLLARPRGEPYPLGVAQAILLSVSQCGPRAARLLGELSVLSSSGARLDLLTTKLDDALAELATRSLVSFDRDGSTALVHRLVRRAVRDSFEREGTLGSLITDVARRLHALVEDIADEDTWRELPTILAVAEHAAALWLCLEQLPDGDDGAGEIILAVRHGVASHLINLNDGARAEPIAEAVVEGRRRLLGDDHPDTLAAVHMLAHAIEYTDRPLEAAALYSRVAAERARVLGDEHGDTLRSRAAAGMAYAMAGEAQRAVTLLEQVVADARQQLVSGDPRLMTARYFQAYALAEADRPGEAVELFDGLVSDYERECGLVHPETLVVRGRLAWAQVAAGHAAAAAELYERVLADQRRVLGVDHPDTLITWLGLARAQEAAGQEAAALAGFEEVAARFEAVLGPEQGLTRAAADDAARLRRKSRQ